MGYGPDLWIARHPIRSASRERPRLTMPATAGIQPAGLYRRASAEFSGGCKAQQVTMGGRQVGAATRRRAGSPSDQRPRPTSQPVPAVGLSTQLLRFSRTVRTAQHGPCQRADKKRLPLIATLRALAGNRAAEFYNLISGAAELRRSRGRSRPGGDGGRRRPIKRLAAGAPPQGTTACSPRAWVSAFKHQSTGSSPAVGQISSSLDRRRAGSAIARRPIPSLRKDAAAPGTVAAVCPAFRAPRLKPSQWLPMMACWNCSRCSIRAAVASSPR